MKFIAAYESFDVLFYFYILHIKQESDDNIVKTQIIIEYKSIWVYISK